MHSHSIASRTHGHVFLGEGHERRTWAVVILTAAAIVSDHPREPDAYKERLVGIEGLSHVTVEVHRGHGATAAA
ncbi:hypothetical protein [Labrys wisconsinensis]|uniref:Uncharacterized protein n=1 Tax=Labrys wisconsinensis TaxID=425677 RepID=A0ABU0JHH3_9HYPH|nr:hypothetical protein [Labrys wisconsinensis]MDQ0473735.1 hypothetical protein [Labrys wisconsinensis]